MLFGFAIDYLSLPIMKGKAEKDDAITFNQLDHSKKKTV